METASVGYCERSDEKGRQEAAVTVEHRFVFNGKSSVLTVWEKAKVNSVIQEGGEKLLEQSSM